jgi:hypothetical protein
MPPEELLIRWPVQRISTTPPVEPFMPDFADTLVELQQTAEIRRTAVVLVVAPKFPVERFLLLIDRIMPMFTTPLRHRFHTAA